MAVNVGDYFGLKLGVTQRSRGQSCIDRSIYQRRGAARVSTGALVDYSDRKDLVAHFVVAPDDAPTWAKDCEQLWSKAAAAEKRVDAQEARLMELSLPRALPKKYWLKLARGLARVFAERGMVVQVDIHCPMACDGLPNPHVHFMMTLRRIRDGKFERKKARDWNDDFRGKAKDIRHKIAEFLNRFCQLRGIDYHADARSNVHRGLPPAEVRLPRWNVLEYKRSGRKTRALEQRDRERTARAEVARLETECREIERELAAARPNAALASSTDMPSLEAIKQRQLFTLSSRISEPAKCSHVEIFSMGPAFSTDLEQPGPRYGP